MPKSGNFAPKKNRPSIRGATNHVADWASVDAEKIRRAIEAATVLGGALRFGYSSDGGAYALGVYYNGESWTEFVRPTEDVDEFLDQVVDWYEAAADAHARELAAAKNGTGKA